MKPQRKTLQLQGAHWAMLVIASGALTLATAGLLTA